MLKFVTILTESYYVGFETLAYSLLRWSPPELPELWIVEDGSVKNYDSLTDMGFKINVRLTEDLAPSDWFPKVNPRIQWNWNKLKLWMLPEDKYVYIDADMLCMNPWDDIFSYPDFSIAEDQKMGSRNLGLFVFQSSPKTYNELLDLTKTLQEEGNQFKNAEQSVISHWLVRGLHPFEILPRKYNMFNKFFSRDPAQWNPKEAVFIHYLGPVKPWDSDVWWGPDKLWKDVRRDYEASRAN
jgi:hypothetical protein